MAWEMVGGVVRLEEDAVVLDRDAGEVTAVGLVEAFEAPGRLGIEPPEVLLAVLREVAERLGPEQTRGASGELRRRFLAGWRSEALVPGAWDFERVGPDGAAQEGQVWLEPVGLRWRVSGGRLDVGRALPDEVFALGPPVWGLPPEVRAEIRWRLTAAVAPEAGLGLHDGFVQLDHASIGEAAWTLEEPGGLRRFVRLVGGRLEAGVEQAGRARAVVLAVERAWMGAPEAVGLIPGPMLAAVRAELARHVLAPEG